MRNVEMHTRLSPLERNIARRIGELAGSISFHTSVAADQLRGVLFHPNSIISRFNPLGATSDQIKTRHTSTWTGTWTGETAGERLIRAGIEQNRITTVNDFLRECKRPTLDELYYVGESTPLYGKATEGIYAEVDGEEKTPPKYYIGLKAVLDNQFLTYEGLRASLN